MKPGKSPIQGWKISNQICDNFERYLGLLKFVVLVHISTSGSICVSGVEQKGKNIVSPVSPAASSINITHTKQKTANCGFTAADKATGRPNPITERSPQNHHLLNSGTVILRPSLKEYDALINAMNTHPDVPNMLFFDQDLLAIVYRNKWMPLPYTYNALKTLRLCHSDLWRDEDVKILHYILNKPWQSRTYADDLVDSTHKVWWDAFAEVEKEWRESLDANKRRLWQNVIAPVVAQE